MDTGHRIPDTAALTHAGEVDTKNLARISAAGRYRTGYGRQFLDISYGRFVRTLTELRIRCRIVFRCSLSV
jgi:hypothetical protein